MENMVASKFFFFFFFFFLVVELLWVIFNLAVAYYAI